MNFLFKYKFFIITFHIIQKNIFYKIQRVSNYFPKIKE